MIANYQGAPIAIIGGGAIGSAIAYYLTQMAPEQPVVVAERDNLLTGLLDRKSVV